MLKRNWVRLISLGLLLFLSVACGSSGSEKKTVNLREEIRVGKALWKVLSVEKKKTIEAAGGAGAKAKGVFILVEVEVKNLSNEDVSLTGAEIEILDEDNRAYTFNTRGNNVLLSYMGRKGLFEGENLSPGQKARGWVLFDVNQDARGLKVKLRDIIFPSRQVGYVNLGL